MYIYGRIQMGLMNMYQKQEQQQIIQLRQRQGKMEQVVKPEVEEMQFHIWEVQEQVIQEEADLEQMEMLNQMEEPEEPELMAEVAQEILEEAESQEKQKAKMEQAVY